MNDIKYKGIGIEDLKEVQKVHFEHIPFEMQPSRDAVERMVSQNNDILEEIKKRTEQIERELGEHFDIGIICEMAIIFLEQRIKENNKKKILKCRDCKHLDMTQKTRSGLCVCKNARRIVYPQYGKPTACDNLKAPSQNACRTGFEPREDQHE